MQTFGDSIKVLRDEIKEFHHCNDALEIKINILTTLVLCTKELFVAKTFYPSTHLIMHCSIGIQFWIERPIEQKWEGKKKCITNKWSNTVKNTTIYYPRNNLKIGKKKCWNLQITTNTRQPMTTKYDNIFRNITICHPIKKTVFFSLKSNVKALQICFSKSKQKESFPHPNVSFTNMFFQI